MEKYMIAYISPEYGLEMTQCNMPNGKEPEWEDVARCLKAEGFTPDAIIDIKMNCNWEVKEIK